MTSINGFIHDLEKEVQNLRSEFHRIYRTDEPGVYYKFSGLCNIMCGELSGRITRLFEHYESEGYFYKGSLASIELVHGEQRHTSKIRSMAWPIEHTWLRINFVEGDSLYVDPTCGQFQWLYSDIPSYYIGYAEPKWFYPDRKNPRFNGLTKYLNRRYRIVEFFQYKVHGSISDFFFAWREGNKTIEDVKDYGQL